MGTATMMKTRNVDRPVAGEVGSRAQNSTPLFEGQSNFREIINSRIESSYDRSQHIPAEQLFDKLHLRIKQRALSEEGKHV